MKTRLIAVSLLLLSAAPALAAPPASCASKFVGEWRHSGSGNRGSVLRDGRALCSEHPACVQGTWTCDGNVLTYTNSMGSFNYTLAPDGKSMSTGTATATRIGAAPAVARSRVPTPTAPVSESASTARPASDVSPKESSVCARLTSSYHAPTIRHDSGMARQNRVPACQALDAKIADAKAAGCDADGNKAVKKEVAEWIKAKSPGGFCSPEKIEEYKQCDHRSTFFRTDDTFFNQESGRPQRCYGNSGGGVRG